MSDQAPPRGGASAPLHIQGVSIDAGLGIESSRARQVTIPGLTGVRFLAASVVAIAHAIAFLPGFHSGVQAWLVGYVSGLAALGMTLFFVLSGFIIHYNYKTAILEGGVRGHWNFFVARFARLYPLFIFLVIAERLSHNYVHVLMVDEAARVRFFEAAPYYITLTQSWFFAVIGKNNLIYQLGSVAAVSWSISTEWFFYLVYPIICFSLSRVRKGSTFIFIGAVISILFIVGLNYVYDNSRAINEYALRHYGQMAMTNPNPQDSLLRWMAYFSPYSRLGEFLVGVCSCSIFLNVRNRRIGPIEHKINLALTVAAIAAILILHVMMFYPGQPFRRLGLFHMSFGFAIPVAVLLYCLARGNNPILSFLSHRWVVFGGELSYSVYLLHVFLFDQLVRRGLYFYQRDSFLSGWLWILFAYFSVFAVATITYRFIEMPARRWLRRVMSIKGRV